jgi:hypothetical protein
LAVRVVSVLVAFEGMEREMKDFYASARWIRALGAAAAVIVLSFLVLMGVVLIYAFVLAFQALGVPDQAAINRFAATISPPMMPWLEALLTFLLAWRGSRAAGASKVDGVLVGVLAGLLSTAVVLAFGGSLGLRSVGMLVVLSALGWLGGLTGLRWSAQS